MKTDKKYNKTKLSEAEKSRMKVELGLNSNVLTSNECAVLIGYSLSFVYQERTLPRIKSEGYRKLYFSRQEVENWMVKRGQKRSD